MTFFLYGLLSITKGHNCSQDAYFKVLYLTQKALEPLLPEHEEASPVVPEPKHLTNTCTCNCLPRWNEFGGLDYKTIVMFVPVFSGGSFRLL